VRPLIASLARRICAIALSFAECSAFYMNFSVIFSRSRRSRDTRRTIR